jgi:hypothetical protein
MRDFLYNYKTPRLAIKKYYFVFFLLLFFGILIYANIAPEHKQQKILIQKQQTIFYQ